MSLSNRFPYAVKLCTIVRDRSSSHLGNFTNLTFRVFTVLLGLTVVTATTYCLLFGFSLPFVHLTANHVLARPNIIYHTLQTRPMWDSKDLNITLGSSSSVNVKQQTHLSATNITWQYIQQATNSSKTWSRVTFQTATSLGVSQQIKPPSTVICITLTGRLGNQMFQYATLFGLAQKLSRIPVYMNDSPLLKSALKNPPSTENRGQYSDRCKRAKRQWEVGCCHFQAAFLQLDPKEDYVVGQYLQSWKYFEGLDTEVLKLMEFKASVQTIADQKISEFRRKYNSTLIGVHVRRGDYLTSNNVKLGYRTAPGSYFEKAMGFMRQRFGNVTFVISVEDTKWFKQSVTQMGDVIFLERQSPEIDMALLSSLDHAILSVGTYSWWVGYLNRGLTVYWKDFIAHNSDIGSSFLSNGETYIYPSWYPL